MILITGSAGFIGSNVVLDWLAQSDEPIVKVAKLPYAGNLEHLASLQGDPRLVFVQDDLGDRALVDHLRGEHRPRAALHFAAESYVDLSIRGPEDFVQTNIVGTFRLLEAVSAHWSGLREDDRVAFCFLHLSTDEVYGTLSKEAPPFAETNPYIPNSPYSASKVASDQLVRAWHHTYGLPVLSINCSNNFGSYQFPETLIPLIIVNALAGKPLLVYCDGSTYKSQITHVKDRPGHNRRYAIDARKIERELGWRPTETFETGIRKTVQWRPYNPEWVVNVQSGAYRKWVTKQYEGAAA